MEMVLEEEENILAPAKVRISSCILELLQPNPGKSSTEKGAPGKSSARKNCRWKMHRWKKFRKLLINLKYKAYNSKN